MSIWLICGSCGDMAKLPHGTRTCPSCGSYGYLTGGFERCAAAHPDMENVTCIAPTRHEDQGFAHDAHVRVRWSEDGDEA